ncbi:MAG: hypothetical protein ACRDZ4_23680 [Egibacteraceae bacterium]
MREKSVTAPIQRHGFFPADRWRELTGTGGRQAMVLAVTKPAAAPSSYSIEGFRRTRRTASKEGKDVYGLLNIGLGSLVLTIVGLMGAGAGALLRRMGRR